MRKYLYLMISILLAAQAQSNDHGITERDVQSACSTASGVAVYRTCKNGKSKVQMSRAAFGMCYGISYSGKLGTGVADSDVNHRQGTYRVPPEASFILTSDGENIEISFLQANRVKVSDISNGLNEILNCN